MIALSKTTTPTIRCAIYTRVYIGRIKHKSETYTGRQEAIVDDAIFDRVQTQLRTNNNNRGNRLPRKSGGLLKGILRCPQCNLAMVHNINRRKIKTYRYYTLADTCTPSLCGVKY